MEFFKLMKRREASPNKKGNKVAYVRPGTDYIEALGSGSAGRKKIPTIWVTAKNGEKFEIPVDPKTGRVPQEYLFGRFLDINRGSRNGRERNILIDIGKEADMIHEIPDGGFTPQQLIETGWWQAVNESDIEGIDDTGARAFARELEDAAKSAQAQGMKMVLLMPDDSQKRVREILARDFNASEVKKAARNGGIIIKEGNPGRGEPRDATSPCRRPRPSSPSSTGKALRKSTAHTLPNSPHIRRPREHPAALSQGTGT